jgi:hypothetical protein
MNKYTTSELIRRALNLADLRNSDFLSYGEHFHYINDAYRTVYQDALNAGEQLYVKECLLDGSGSREYDIPDDLYQIIAITNNEGDAVRRKDPRQAESTTGYEIKNNKLVLSNVFGGAVLKYIPVPETLTFRAPSKEVEIPIDVVSGYDTKVVDNKGNIYDISTGEYIVNTENEDPIYDFVVMGKNSFIAKPENDEHCYLYNFNGTSFGIYDKPLLTDDGRFIHGPDEQVEHSVGCVSDDGTAKFYWVTDDDGYAIKYNDTVISEKMENTHPLRYLYWDGKNACIYQNYLINENGDVFLLDMQEGILLKTDLETGYGFLESDAGTTYVKGWLPETAIDYPNNIFFSMVAYKLAMAYRTKQNADITMLAAEYESLLKTYVASLSNNGQDYPTIRNVYSNRGWY